MLFAILAFQTAAITCTPAATCRLLEAAAAANARAMVQPGGYTAFIETETAMLGRRESRIEGATTLEQTASEARWSSDGIFEQHIVGSRSFPNAIPLSRLAFLKIGWVAPTLLGERIQVISRTGPREASFEQTLVGPLAPDVLVHPLASDRDRFYSYTGGQTVQRMVDGRMMSVIAIEVTPVKDLTREETLFEGEMELDPATNMLVRLYGRMVVIGKKTGGFMNFEPAITLIDLVNQRLSDGTWAPRVQRYELQTSSSLALGHGAARRVITRFHNTTPVPGRPGSLGGVAASTSGYLLTSAPRDSLRHFRNWRLAEGQATDAVSEDDFARYRANRYRPEGPPILLVQGFHRSDFIRLNRIEGIFTGISLIERFRDKAPGWSVAGSAGWAWWEHRVRGAAGIAKRDRKRVMELGVVRSLDVTNKFRNQFDNPSTAGLVGRDPWDYLERQSVGASFTRLLKHKEGSILQLEVSRTDDNAVDVHKEKSWLGGLYRPNRTITEGSYWRSRLTFDWSPSVSPLFARNGVGVHAEVENGNGDLDYTRLEARIVTRHSLGGRFFIITRLHGGATVGDTPPQQQLFEMGGPVGLPGYDYKEFAGNRGVLFRTRVTYPLGFFDQPYRLGSGLTIPSLSPAVSIGFQSGFTDATNPGARAAVRSLGDKRDDKTGELILDSGGLTLPAAVPSDKFRSSVDIRVGIFGDALAVGFARALDSGRKTKFIFAFGRQF